MIDSIYIYFDSVWKAGASVVNSIHSLMLNARDEQARDSPAYRQILYGVEKGALLNQ